jgi:hypothetical protein
MHQRRLLRFLSGSCLFLLQLDRTPHEIIGQPAERGCSGPFVLT